LLTARKKPEPAKSAEAEKDIEKEGEVTAPTVEQPSTPAGVLERLKNVLERLVQREHEFGVTTGQADGFRKKVLELDREARADNRRLSWQSDSEIAAGVLRAMSRRMAEAGVPEDLAEQLLQRDAWYCPRSAEKTVAYLQEGTTFSEVVSR
jgi:hypothetical protein